ncbi:MAG: hypothetical protein NTV94_19130, partial [Planctomycetota bacterium]|nr:hypothetical protein [Planctomycetota bacterium]
MPEESETPIIPPQSPAKPPQPASDQLPLHPLTLTGDAKRDPHTGPKLTGKVRRGLALMRF